MMMINDDTWWWWWLWWIVLVTCESQLAYMVSVLAKSSTHQRWPYKKMQKQHLPFCDLLERLYHHHPTCGISIRIYIFFGPCNISWLLPATFWQLYVISIIYIHRCMYTVFTYTRTGLTLTTDVFDLRLGEDEGLYEKQGENNEPLRRRSKPRWRSGAFFSDVLVEKIYTQDIYTSIYRVYINLDKWYMACGLIWRVVDNFSPIKNLHPSDAVEQDFIGWFLL